MMNLKVRKVLFWDLDFDKLDTEKHKLHIIQQVLNLGNIDEFNTVLDHYGFEEVKDAVQNIGYLDPKTFSFVLWFFNLENEDLQCYTKNRLHQPHWS